MAYGQHGSSAGGGLRKALSWVFYIVFVIGLVWLLQNFVVCPYTIPSGSMEDTIEVGDNVWSEKITYYTHEPQAGDIVTFEDPEIAGRTLIKREPLKTAANVSISYPYTIPEGYLWVMGDNRTDSADSRYFGPIDSKTVTGRAVAIYWPLNHIGVL